MARICGFILVALILTTHPAASWAQSSGDVLNQSSPLSQTQNGCPTTHPLACTTTACCPSNLPYFCNKLKRKHPDGAAPKGWSGCVSPATDESLKWWSDSCQPVWVQCY